MQNSNYKMDSALLFANGQVTEKEIEKLGKLSFEVVVAADGGARHALQWGYYPHYVVGDLDSVSPDLRKRLNRSTFVHRPSQELNDLEKALIHCRELQINRLTLLGVAGKRLDHTLNNLSVVSRYTDSFHFTIFDAHSEIFFVTDEWTGSGELHQIISLIPIGEVSGVMTEGLAFPLNNEALIFGKREGLSNYIISNPVKVRIKSGLLVVFLLDR